MSSIRFHAIVTFAVLLLSITPLGGFGAPGARAQNEDPALAGRLGGTLDSFIERFGEPYDTSQDPLFVIDGYGYVGVQPTALKSAEEIKRIRVITISAPRPLEIPAGEPDANDWTPDEARDRVLEFLPTDIDLADFEAGESNDLTATCQSDALQEVFGVLTLGECRVNLIKSGDDTISYATMTLTAGALIEASPTVESDPCEGALDWIKTTGERLARTQSLLATIADIDESDPDAPAQLHEIAQGFRDLAIEQRETDAPKVARNAAFYVISALNTYATAIDGAADGLETGDQATIDTALEDLAAAGDAVNRATSEIEKTAESCNLELGTPVP